jgi:hypothetical protein
LIDSSLVRGGLIPTPRVRQKLLQNEPRKPTNLVGRVTTESVSSILARESGITIQNWLDLVEQSAELAGIPLSRDERIGHLPILFRDLILRLQFDSRAPALFSDAARHHGTLRRHQGYTAAMVVEESRILQISIFSTLQRNLSCVDITRVLSDVVIIADECDSQLKQAILCYYARGTA